MVFTPALLKLPLDCLKDLFYDQWCFLLYMNDINNAIMSQIKLFADGSVLYINICNQNDQVILQNDLDAISSWAEKWLMDLNINKCSVLYCTQT